MLTYDDFLFMKKVFRKMWILLLFLFLLPSTRHFSPISFLTLHLNNSSWSIRILVCHSAFQEEELKGAVVLIYANKQVHVVLIFLFCLFMSIYSV